MFDKRCEWKINFDIDGKLLSNKAENEIIFYALSSTGKKIKQKQGTFIK